MSRLPIEYSLETLSILVYAVLHRNNRTYTLTGGHK